VDDLELEGRVPKYQTPGVYREDIFEEPSPELRTGVPAFLGIDEKGPDKTPQRLTMWSQFVDTFGDCDLEHGYLAYAVRGFFQNGGELCYVMRIKDSTEDSMRDGLAALASIDTIDLVCAPDIMQGPDQAITLQKMVLDHCDTSGDRFAILDALPGTPDEALKQKESLSSANGALYYPWLDVGQRGEGDEVYFVPPCGHVAGVYARSDWQVGVHKAPANEVLEDVLDLKVSLTNADQSLLNSDGVNCLRAFPGRGIRVWGARTLAPKQDTEWAYVNVRRLFLTAGRWIEHMMSAIVFEPNDARLWMRIERELTAYFDDLFRRGALQGRSPQEAFYVKCNAETNPPEVRELGQVITEIGLAPTCPAEFVVVRIIHGASGVNMVAPAQLEQQT
jgi:phage tail sheath protein FI